MYVTAKHEDSQITSKYQIWVKIEKVPPDSKKNTTSTNQNFAKSQINFPGYNKIPPSELPWRKPLTKLNNVNGTSPSSTTQASVVKSTSTTQKSFESSHSHVEESTRTKSNDEESSTKSSANNSKTVEPALIPSREPSGKLIIALIPTIVIFTSLFILGIIACLFRKKICKTRNKIKKDDMVRLCFPVLILYLT